MWSLESARVCAGLLGVVRLNFAGARTLCREIKCSTVDFLHSVDLRNSGMDTLRRVFCAFRKTAVDIMIFSAKWCRRLVGQIGGSDRGSGVF